ncbi:FAD-dependent monooxygenase [Candidatus Methanoprimaticola sp. MG2]|uniref:NAD(P)/FAD-dependent oxidoreductase n=1 Tax=Candidatus Methanoprimaticola sp. MG2 TaxID=3228838 RepID=UPI0039C660A6
MADEAARVSVVIVGAGPAGMSAAMTLSGRMDTIVIERLDDARFGRYHSICGEAVSDRSFKRLGWMPSAIVRRVDAIGISSSGGRSIAIPVKGSIVDRPSMLAEMRSRCDARFVRGSVRSVERTDDGFRLTLCDGRTFECGWLLGADGAHSTVRRDVFHADATDRLPIVNCIAEGDADPVLGFTVAGRYSGGYSWLFPSKPGTVSVGFPKGCGDPAKVEGLREHGARDLPFGVLDTVADGNCALIGDAACLANPLCYGGIGAALLSGRFAAEAILKGDLGIYGRWVAGDRMFDHRFMDAHRTFCSWTDDEIEDAMMPFEKGYSVLRGLYAILRRPGFSNLYMAIFIALRIGW